MSQDTKGLDKSQEQGKFELKQQFVELRAKGWSYAKIGRKLGLSIGTFTHWSRELETEIASLRALELEALYERYFLLKEARLKLFGEQVKAIVKELKGRSLEDISTDKLLELLLKYAAALEAEHIELKPLSQSEIELLRSLD